MGDNPTSEARSPSISTGTVHDPPPPSRRSPRLTVIVPVGPGETAWIRLLSDLAQQLPGDAEVIVSAVEPEPPTFAMFGKTHGWMWRQTRPGRACQMNDAARDATGDALWFLHADTRLPTAAFSWLFECLQVSPNAIHFFGLRFYDGPGLLRLNELGVELRCRLFKLPFGDQGYCLTRETFNRLGGFDESAAYGEDHLLIWSAKRAGAAIRQLPTALGTSGRKYAESGWLKTTITHLWLTARQAIPAALRRPP